MAAPSKAAESAPEPPLMKALRAEHRHMAGVMQLFLDQLQLIESGGDADAHVIYEIMDYMVSWPDEYHHPREDLIYSRVAELDGKAADEVDTLQRDHDRTAKNGRKLLADIRAWRKGDLADEKLVAAGRAYVEHCYEHMNVEEKLVFPHIEEVLSLDDWRDLAADDQLKSVSVPVFGPAVQREFRTLTRRLRRRVRHTAEKGAVAELIGIEALMESLDVVSRAYESAGASASDHFHTAVEDARSMFQEEPLTAPLRCVANNTRLSVSFAKEVVALSRDAIDDLAELNGERLQRLKKLAR
ncbi:hemerythrin domain-containing protein [Halioglobus maricola]|nr:hemerythrin domain-containing protein [Halioglobus maricola]